MDSETTKIPRRSLGKRSPGTADPAIEAKFHVHAPKVFFSCGQNRCQSGLSAVKVKACPRQLFSNSPRKDGSKTRAQLGHFFLSAVLSVCLFDGMEEVIGSIPIRSTNIPFVNNYLPTSASSLLRVRRVRKGAEIFADPRAASILRLLGSLRAFAGRPRGCRHQGSCDSWSVASTPEQLSCRRRAP